MKRFEKSFQVEKVELPYQRQHLYLLRLGDDIVFIDPSLVEDWVFRNSPYVVFPLNGKLTDVGYNAYAIKAVSPAFSSYVLYLLSEEELKDLDEQSMSRTHRVGDKFFLHSLPFPDVEEEWDEDDDYYDDEYDEYEDDESEVSEDSSVE